MAANASGQPHSHTLHTSMPHDISHGHTLAAQTIATPPQAVTKASGSATAAVLAGEPSPTVLPVVVTHDVLVSSAPQSRVDTTCISVNASNVTHDVPHGMSGVGDIAHAAGLLSANHTRPTSSAQTVATSNNGNKDDPPTPTCACSSRSFNAPSLRSNVGPGLAAGSSQSLPPDVAPSKEATVDRASTCTNDSSTSRSVVSGGADLSVRTTPVTEHRSQTPIAFAGQSPSANASLAQALNSTTAADTAALAEELDELGLNEQHRRISELLTPIVSAFEPEHYDKIVGMLLEYDVGELVSLLSAPERLGPHVKRAADRLRQTAVTATGSADVVLGPSDAQGQPSARRVRERDNASKGAGRGKGKGGGRGAKPYTLQADAQGTATDGGRRQLDKGVGFDSTSTSWPQLTTSHGKPTSGTTASTPQSDGGQQQPQLSPKYSNSLDAIFDSAHPSTNDATNNDDVNGVAALSRSLPPLSEQPLSGLTEATACSSCGYVSFDVVGCVFSGKWLCNRVALQTADSVTTAFGEVIPRMREGGSPLEGGLEREVAMRSCIIDHLVTQSLNAIRTHPLSRWGQTTLICSTSRNSDVFELGVAIQRTDSFAVITRGQASLHCPGLVWEPFVEFEDGAPVRLAAWFAPVDRVVIAAAVQRAAKRRLTRAIPMPGVTRFASPLQYYKAFSPLVAHAAAADAGAHVEGAADGVSVRWGVGTQSEHTLTFTYVAPTRNPLVVNDQVVIRTPLLTLADIASGPTIRELRGAVISVSSASADDRAFEVVVSVDTVYSPLVDTTLVEGYTVRKQLHSVTYDRMQTALLLFTNNEESTGPSLRRALLDPQTTIEPFSVVDVPRDLDIRGQPRLNDSQRAAVLLTLRQDLTLIEGPPGTGKTKTLANAIWHHVHQRNGQILVCGPSGVAATNMANEIHALGMTCIRYFPATRDEKDAVGLEPQIRIDHWIQEGTELQKLQQLRQAHTLSRDDSKLLRELKRKLYRSALPSVQIIVCTCSAAGDSLIRRMRFHTVFVDEAAQATEPDCLVPVVNGCRKLILVGDTRQLRPVVLSAAAQRGGLQVSMFERLRLAGARYVQLNEQYRMHNSLSSFPSLTFYDGLVKDGPHVQQRRRADVSFAWPRSDHLTMFWHIRDGRGSEHTSGVGGSYSNAPEAFAAALIARALVTGGARAEEIVILTMYEAQTRLVRTHVDVLPTAVRVSNVDALQGHERAFVILSLVRSNNTHSVGFLEDTRRACVALTRAKSGLVVIGDAVTLGQRSPWADLVEYYATQELIVTGPFGAFVKYEPDSVENNAVASVYQFDAHRQSETRSGLLSQQPLPLDAATVTAAADQLRDSYCVCSTHCSHLDAAERERTLTDCLRRARVLALANAPLGESDNILPDAVDDQFACEYRATQERPGKLGTTAQATSSVAGLREALFTADLSGNPPTTSETDVLAVTLLGVDGQLHRYSTSRLAPLRLFTFWWRSRVAGYLSSKQAIRYWTFANSKSAEAAARFRTLVESCSFRSNVALRERHRVRPTAAGHYLKLCVSRSLFRVVRAMQCAYGSMACRFPVSDAEGNPLYDKTGARVTRTFMATESDFKNAASDTDLVTGWYLPYGDAVRAYCPGLVFEAGYGKPGGTAMGIWMAGFDVVIIDNSDDLGDTQRWFHTRLPELYPGSPLVRVVRGDATMLRDRARAVAEHPRSHEVAAIADSPECDRYGTPSSVGGSVRPEGAPARRQHATRGQQHENLTEAIAKAHERWAFDTIPYVIETVVGANPFVPDGVACTIYEAVMFGVRTQDRHKFYHPATLPLYVDSVLVDWGRWLRSRTCTGCSGTLPPLQPHGAVTRSCCNGQMWAMNGNTSSASLGVISRSLGFHPEHITSFPNLCDAIPYRFAQHTSAVLGMWVAHVRLGVPCVSHDSAKRDPRLAAWISKALCSGGSQRLALPVMSSIIVFTPSNLPGHVLVERRPGGSFRLPSVGMARYGDLHRLIADGFSDTYADFLEPSRLSFVADLLPVMVFHSSSLPCNDAHAMPRASVGADGALSLAGGGTTGEPESDGEEVATLLAIPFSAYVEHVSKGGAGSFELAAVVAILQHDSLLPRDCTVSPSIARALTIQDARGQRHATALEVTPQDARATTLYLQGRAERSSLPHFNILIEAGQRQRTPVSDETDTTIEQLAVRGARLEFDLLARSGEASTGADQAFSTTPQVLTTRQDYLKARESLGVASKLTDSVSTPFFGRPQPLEVTSFAVLITHLDKVITYAQSPEQLALFTGPARKYSAAVAAQASAARRQQARSTRGHTPRARPEQPAQVMAASIEEDLTLVLLPWFSGFSQWDRIKSVIAEAAAAVTTHDAVSEAVIKTASSNDSGQLPSRVVPGTALKLLVVRIELPTAFDWTTVPQPRSVVTRPRPSQDRYDRTQYVPVLARSEQTQLMLSQPVTLSDFDHSVDVSQRHQQLQPTTTQSPWWSSEPPETLLSIGQLEFISHLQTQVGRTAVARAVSEQLPAVATAHAAVVQSGFADRHVRHDEGLESFISSGQDMPATNSAGETRQEAEANVLFCEDLLRLMQHRATQQGEDLATRQWIDLYFEPHSQMLAAILRGDKDIETRLATPLYRLVAKGWLVCCRTNSAGLGVWLEVQHVFNDVASHADAARRFGSRVMPGFNGSGSPEAFEYRAYELHARAKSKRQRHHGAVTNTSMIRHLEEWHRRTGTPGSVICWQIRVLGSNAVLPSRRTYVESPELFTNNAMQRLGQFFNRLRRTRNNLDAIGSYDREGRTWARLATAVQARDYARRLRSWYYGGFQAAACFRNLSTRLDFASRSRRLRGFSLRHHGRRVVHRFQQQAYALALKADVARLADAAASWAEAEELAPRADTPPPLINFKLQASGGQSVTASVSLSSEVNRSGSVAAAFEPAATDAPTDATGSNRVTRVVRTQGLLDPSLHEGEQAVTMLATAADCVAARLSGLSAEVAELFTHARQDLPPSKHGVYRLARRSDWRTPGSTSAYRSTGGAPTVYRLHAQWAPGAPRKHAKPFAIAEAPFRGTPHSDTIQDRRQWFHKALEALSLSIDDESNGTIAFAWSDCRDFDAHLAVAAFARKHSNIQVIVVQRSDEVITKQFQDAQASIEQARRAACAFIKRSDAGPETQVYATALAHSIERDLLSTLSEESLGPDGASIHDVHRSFADTMAASATQLEAAAELQAYYAKKEIQRSNEATDVAFQNQLRQFRRRGQLTDRQIGVMHEQHQQVMSVAANAATVASARCGPATATIEAARTGEQRTARVRKLQHARIKSEVSLSEEPSATVALAQPETTTQSS